MLNGLCVSDCKHYVEISNRRDLRFGVAYNASCTRRVYISFTNKKMNVSELLLQISRHRFAVHHLIDAMKD